MTSTHIYPYVYRGIHPTTGEFYIGMRSANKVPAEADLGIKYKTSSKVVQPRFDEFDWHVVAEFFTREAAYDFEQLLIFENMHDAHILNKACFHEYYARFWNADPQPATDETRRKMSISQTGKKRLPRTEEQKRHLSDVNTGKRHTEESKKKMSISSTGCKHSDETKTKLSQIFRGVSKSPEHREKMSRAKLGVPKSPEHRAKLAANCRKQSAARSLLRRLEKDQRIVGATS